MEEYEGEKEWVPLFLAMLSKYLRSWLLMCWFVWRSVMVGCR